jgi:hypothetical protein
MYWLLGLSALGYSPAECTEMINTARLRAGQEAIGSGAYFGDPTNSAWPTCDASIGKVSGSGATLRVRWPTSTGILIAKLPCRSWSQLIERDLLDVCTDHPSQPLVSLLPDPWSDASIVLAIPRATGETISPVYLRLSTLETAVSRNVGSALADAVDNIGWLGALPSFRVALAKVSQDLEDKLIQIRRSVAEREDHALLPDLVHFARRAEGDAAHQFDELLIETALMRSQTRWELLEEYEGRSRTEQIALPSRCANCGASARVAKQSDYVRPDFKRLVLTCSSCGIVGDLPVWPLEINLDAASLRWIHRTLLGRAKVFNHGDDERRIVLGATLVGGGQIEAGSSERLRRVLVPRSGTEFEFAVTHRQLVSGTMRFRVFIASRGGFGFVGGILLVPPGTLADRH